MIFQIELIIIINNFKFMNFIDTFLVLFIIHFKLCILLVVIFNGHSVNTGRKRGQNPADAPKRQTSVPVKVPVESKPE